MLAVGREEEGRMVKKEIYFKGGREDIHVHTFLLSCQKESHKDTSCSILTFLPSPLRQMETKERVDDLQSSCR